MSGPKTLHLTAVPKDDCIHPLLERGTGKGFLSSPDFPHGGFELSKEKITREKGMSNAQWMSTILFIVGMASILVWSYFSQ